MRRSALILTLLAVALLGLAACAPKTTPAPTAASPSQTSPAAPTETTAPLPVDPSPTAMPPTATQTPEPTRTPSSVQATAEAVRATIDAQRTAGPQPTPTPSGGFLLADVGFASPESVSVDDFNGWILVSNINGSPTAQDDNGFISRVRLDGTLSPLKFIDGANEGYTLNAPKGMLLVGGALVVTDIDTVRIFNRANGEFAQDIPVPGAQFLNDITAGEAAFYVTDSSAGKIFQISFPDLVASEAFPGVEIGSPNGITFAFGVGLFWTDDSTRSVKLLPSTDTADAAGEAVTYCTLPAGGLDGLVYLEDGSLLVSSWQTNAVYRCTQGQEGVLVMDGFDGPADFAYAPEINLVYVPSFMANQLDVRPLP